MNAFIFQSRADIFDLREHLQPGKRDTWYATRYRSIMQPGDIVLFWMAGDERLRGLYGWGQIASEPYLKPSWDSHGVDVIYKDRFEQPIQASVLRKNPVLSELLIFRAPQASNFLIRPAEARTLSRVLKDHGNPISALEEVQ